MLIGYRRYSSPIGISPHEKSRVSGWVEKRKALLGLLHDRGHEVLLLSPPTANSKGLYSLENNKNRAKDMDALFIEMSNHNLLHNYEAIAETVNMMNECGCPVFILWDDPELKIDTHRNKYPLPKLKLDEAIIFVNAEYIEPDSDAASRALFRRTSCTVGKPVFEFFPIVSIMEYNTLKESPNTLPFWDIEDCIYIGGTSGGRDKVLQGIQSVIPLTIFSEYKGDLLKVAGQRPPQNERRNCYSNFATNLGLQDKKHKRLGWLTGRCFHALSAGTPSLVEADSNLAKYFTPYTLDNLAGQLEMCKAQREECVQESIKKVLTLKKQLLLTLEKYGM